MSIPGWRHVYSGKVRELYESEADSSVLLVIASDRVSAFDHVLEPAITGKGALLTELSLWWFAQLAGADGGAPIANHLIADAVLPDLPADVAARTMLVQKLEMLPIECVVRGYLTGSGWVEYQASQTVCGVALPAGLHDGDKLPEPIYTPAYKAPLGEHDVNITFEQSVELVGFERASALRDLSLDIYTRAADQALEHGVILADTKFEFGVDADGVIRLGDEVLTSDSSRYWDAAAWRNGSTPAERMASFDKQIVRDWLAANWDKTGEPPVLPDAVVERTLAKYRELLQTLSAA